MITSTQSESLRFEQQDNGIISVFLDGGDRPVVVLDRVLIQRLNSTLDELVAIENITGLILRSDCKRVFVAGADLAEIDSLDDQGLHAYLAFGTTVFERIAKLPYPTVALINGSTLGGGLEIALHCDCLVASSVAANSKPYPIGLPEAGLGICPGWGGTQLLPARIHPATAIEATATGKPFTSSSFPDGLIDIVVDTPEQLQAAAEQWIQEQSGKSHALQSNNEDNAKVCASGLREAKSNITPTEAATSVFHAVEVGIDAGWTSAVATEQCELVRLRNTTVAREKLDAFLSKG